MENAGGIQPRPVTGIGESPPLSITCSREGRVFVLSSNGLVEVSIQGSEVETARRLIECVNP